VRRRARSPVAASPRALPRRRHPRPQLLDPVEHDGDGNHAVRPIGRLLDHHETAAIRRAHLTRDFTEHFWRSFDTGWYTGGQATISGVTGDKLNNFGLGFTVGYKSTLDDLAPEDLRMDNFTVSLVYGWHSLIEGARRLTPEK
jgi:hypothetical protein